ncbi:cell wall-binding repeat-containing protein [Clostridium tetani]|nr:cell wall-binding repeat-containing protein [Clostridium tetani]RXM75544.1 cell wall-binding repeat-containing protein [Clostridium tetani]RYU98787.1 cell wall-binding repeat-containing protein [Clostridium tetani]
MMKKILTLVLTIVMSLSNFTKIYAHDITNIKRIYGKDRYKTSVNISSNFKNGSLQNIIVASGKNFPDALAGSVLSKKLDAPIVLGGSTLEESKDCIEYINNNLNKDGTIYLLGGQSSINNSFENHMKNKGFKNIVRLGGNDRFETNMSIVNFMDVKKNTPVVIVNAFGFADALSISSVASIKGYPIIMTSDSELSLQAKDMLEKIQPKEVYIIGGHASIKDTIKDEIKSIFSSIDENKIKRLEGKDRYETSLNICKYFNLDTDNAVLANGSNFPDALSGSALASKLNSPIVLTNGNDISNQKSFIENKKYKNLYLLGGFASIGLNLEYSLKGPNNITENEKNYINSLINYCSKFYSESNTASLYILETFEDIFSHKVVSDLSSENKSEELLDNIIKGYSNLETYFKKHRENLITLRNNVYNLQSPENLVFLKENYITNIDNYIDNVDKITEVCNSYKKSLTNIRANSKINNFYDLKKELEKISTIEKTFLNINKNLEKSEQSIGKLMEDLSNIRNSME